MCVYVWPLSSAPVGVSLLSGFPIQVWVPPGSCAKVGEAPVCVRVPRPPARPRRRRCAGDTPASLGGSDGPSARGHARYLPSRPLCVRANSSRPGRGRSGCVGASSALVSQPLSWSAPQPRLDVSPSLGDARPPRLGVTAPLLGCSPPNPPRARGRAACSLDPPPCSSSRAGVRPRVSPRAWVLASACSPGCGFSF